MYPVNLKTGSSFDAATMRNYGGSDTSYLALDRTGSREAWDLYPSSFEQKVKTELDGIATLSHDLHKRMSEENSSEEDKQQISRDYFLLENAKKLVAFIIEEMQKVAQAIAANFR